MATKEIKQKIVLEGEKQYNQAIREAQRNIRTLKSELKAETAELGKNATEQQKAEAKAKGLKQQIAEQEKIVKTLREALAAAKKEYGDNADVVQSWEQKLNGARTTLANMKNDLDGVGQKMGNMGANAAQATVATKSMADSLGKIADAGGGISSAIENIFTGMVSTVRSAIGAVWDDLIQLAAKANSFGDLAGIWNTDLKTIQTWSAAVKGASDNFEDLSAAVNKINYADPKVVASLTGVSSANYEDQWEYAMKVLEAMSKMGEGEQQTALEKIFGAKKGDKVEDLLDDWDKIQENFGKFGKIGPTEEELSSMSDLYDQVNRLQQTWELFKDSFTAGAFGQLALDLTGGGQAILDSLISFMQTGSDEDLAKLEENIAEFFDRLKKALENAAEKLSEAGKKLQESDNGIVRLIGQIMSGLGEAMGWLAEEGNIDKVVAALEALAAFWLVGKGVQMAMAVSEFAANIKVLQGMNLLGGATGAAGAAGAAAAPGLAGASESLSAAITGSLGPIAGSVAGIAASIAGGLMIAGFAAGALAVIGRLIKGESPEETAARETVENAAEVGKQMEAGGAKVAPDVKNEVGKGILEAIFTGNASRLNNLAQQQRETEVDTIAAAAAAAVEALPQTQVESGGPTGIWNKRGRLDATAEQQAAVEAYWDILRSGNWGEGDADLDSAWDAMAAAFGGEGSALFGRLDTLLQRLVDEHSAAETETGYDPAQWMDVPSTWWQNPGGGDSGNNGVTGEDLAGLRSLPAGVQNAVQRGAAAGVSGIKVTLDGQAVGALVAPYVSEMIARSIE